KTSRLLAASFGSALARSLSWSGAAVTATCANAAVASASAAKSTARRANDVCIERSYPFRMAFDLILFGGTGDLTWRKLMPALFQAWRHGKLPGGGRI